MKKVLIFTASTGGGHNQAAKSLALKFESYGYEVIVVDILKLNNKIMEKLFVEGYEILSCSLPTVYRGLYNYSNKKSINVKLSKYIYKIFKTKIYKSISTINPDLIVGTHAFIVNIVSGLKEKGKIFIPFISVVTDFKAHSSYFGECVDAYVTGSEYTNIGMINEGIPENKLYCYGIPIREEFLLDQNSNRDMDNSDRDLTILLMGGSMGLKSIEKVLKALVNCEDRLKIIVVCGNNNSLMKRIKSEYMKKFKNKEVLVHGFTNDISKLMEESDILISKPGGLTVSEAIAKRLPILIPYMLPGQEEDNAEFLSDSRIAMVVNEIGDIREAINNLIAEPESLENMKINMEKISQNYSVDNIVKLGQSLIYKYALRYKLIGSE